MSTQKYDVSEETSAYVAASIENNKFSIGFAGAPLLSLVLFVALHEGKLEQTVQMLLLFAALCLFVSLMYGHYRFLYLSRIRAILLSGLATGQPKEVQIRRPGRLLSMVPGVALFLGLLSLIVGLSVAIWS